MLAESLTHVPAERGADVAIMDADPNATAYRWATTVREGTPIQSHAEADAKLLAVLLPTLREKHATLILDTVGFGIQAAAVAIAAADLVLVPVTPGEGHRAPSPMPTR
jgi:cellulose biosynthesis protein BcsQ